MGVLRAISDDLGNIYPLVVQKYMQMRSNKETGTYLLHCLSINIKCLAELVKLARPLQHQGKRSGFAGNSLNRYGLCGCAWRFRLIRD
jgi:hypothetical protein